ncbi:MAG TPA: poly-beta-1,6-N-acetyl-D-glucosamine biosynthesis protein PgaD [Frateuria sp.]|uniref:poly-beta-1,6-N-acetyl-D-glucosamine biosynthesis protein PgaD n=1 Tax=Frateuria sp. TaxID=2211372 RepID=UPI002D7FFF9F|nr:poly-beta-1,6-N-acetyl-D-glucosamine biosynthesis protein PgaD [Frateuria sp.]HET6804948.1 poly-beta-1,6-N-acetyl-D-glucosamine biosynthesis protein PgaD [Frateuria sp.]
MKAEGFLIQNERRRTPAKRALSSLATLVAWMLWLYLWLPVLTLVAWLAGLRTAWVELSAEAYANQTSDLLAILGYALVCAVVFASWAYYNQARFAHRTRRRHGPAAVTLAEEAMALDVDPREAQAMRAQRHSTLVFDRDARPVVRRSADREPEPA